VSQKIICKADALPTASHIYSLFFDRVVFRLGLKSLIESTFSAFLQATKRFFAYALLRSKANVHTTRPNFERCKFSLPRFFKSRCNFSHFKNQLSFFLSQNPNLHYPNQVAFSARTNSTGNVQLTAPVHIACLSRQESNCN
jgi:hypothetical protein